MANPSVRPLSRTAPGASVCVVLLNWNGWADTLECLESLLRIRGVALQVVVCDNDSSDSSVEHIRAWAEGRLDVVVPPDTPLRSLTFPPGPKPVRYALYDRATAEAGGDPADADAPLVLVRTGGNLGFAGGCNVGLRFALARGVHTHAWLLNNDTAVRPDTLAHLLDLAGSDPAMGIVGSTLLYYSRPDTVQAMGGGAYNPWFGVSRHLGALSPADEAGRGTQPEQMAYVVGASMLVSRPFLLDVGLLSEEYFLFFEELDWAMRARGGWRLGYAPASVVYHREGAAIGGDSRGGEKSWTADYYYMKNRIVFTRKYLPSRLPTIYLALLGAMARRAARRQWARVWMIAKVCLTT